MTGTRGKFVVVAFSCAAALAGAAVAQDDEEIEPPDLTGRLPKQKLAPPLATKPAGADAVAKAKKLNVEGLTLHRKKEYAAAEAKYLEALAADPSHLYARYNLACVLNMTNRGEAALALLLEMADGGDGCAGCGATVNIARSDEEWRSQWQAPVFLQILKRVDLAFSCDGEALTCAKGTAKKGSWKPDERDFNEVYCAKGATKEGPYVKQEQGYDLSEGVAWSCGSYKGGKKHGLWSEGGSFHGGTLGAYTDGVPTGVWSTYNPRESWPEGYTVYLHETDGKLITVVELSRMGIKTREAQYEKAAISKAGWTHDVGRQGRWWEGYDTGKPRVEGRYEKNKKHGTWTTWHESGKMASRGVYAKDEPAGLFEYWDRSGKPLGKAEMAGGTGDWVDYDADGQLRGRGAYAKGKKQGAWKLRDGGDYCEGSFDKDKRAGRWSCWDKPGGRKLVEGEYAAGARTGAWSFWSRESGKEQASGSYKKGKPDGHWKLFDEQGKLVQELDFKNGKLAKVDGHKADGDYQRGLKHSTFPDAPMVIEPISEELDAAMEGGR